MTIQECYNLLKGSYGDAINRLMNDRLVERFMLMFEKDESIQNLNKAVEEGVQKDAFRAVHSLKGVAGNLAFTQLQKSASALTEQLRDGTQMPDPTLLEAVRRDYKLVIDTIEQYKAEK